ncbi:MAG: hypothetical protein V1664_04235 [Candidatus Uhrbacteria bacterium]
MTIFDFLHRRVNRLVEIRIADSTICGYIDAVHRNKDNVIFFVRVTLVTSVLSGDHIAQGKKAFVVLDQEIGNRREGFSFTDDSSRKVEVIFLLAFL